MGLLTAPDSALTTKPARIVLWVVFPLLQLESCECFQTACKSKTDVPCLCRYPSLWERFPTCGFWCGTWSHVCAGGGRAVQNPEQTDHWLCWTQRQGHGISLRQLNMGWRRQVPLLSLTVAHVPPDFIQMPRVLQAIETAVALVETGKLFLRCKSLKPLSYWVPGERNKGTNTSGRGGNVWVELEPRWFVLVFQVQPPVGFPHSGPPPCSLFLSIFQRENCPSGTAGLVFCITVEEKQVQNKKKISFLLPGRCMG